jgi:hypothetical protein|tara:strand:- start:2273 stop:2434 length:162 start_codon:yes stop_codon:yes gene_type:complete
MIKDFTYRLIAFIIIITILPILLIALAFDVLVLNNNGEFISNYLDKWKTKKNK